MTLISGAEAKTLKQFTNFYKIQLKISQNGQHKQDSNIWPKFSVHNFLQKKKDPNYTNIQLNGNYIPNKNTIKILGMHFDKKKT